jgi:hypothetical protein
MLMGGSRVPAGMRLLPILVVLLLCTPVAAAGATIFTVVPRLVAVVCIPHGPVVVCASHVGLQVDGEGICYYPDHLIPDTKPCADIWVNCTEESPCPCFILNCLRIFYST